MLTESLTQKVSLGDKWFWKLTSAISNSFFGMSAGQYAGAKATIDRFSTQKFSRSAKLSTEILANELYTLVFEKNESHFLEKSKLIAPFGIRVSQNEVFQQKHFWRWFVFLSSWARVNTEKNWKTPKKFQQNFLRATNCFIYLELGHLLEYDLCQSYLEFWQKNLFFFHFHKIGRLNTRF